MDSTRLNKYLATNLGVSRREADILIERNVYIEVSFLMISDEVSAEPPHAIIRIRFPNIDISTVVL